MILWRWKVYAMGLDRGYQGDGYMIKEGMYWPQNVRDKGHIRNYTVDKDIREIKIRYKEDAYWNEYVYLDVRIPKFREV